MSQTTEVRPATTVLAIRPTIVLEAVAEGIKVTGSGWEQVVAMSQTGVRDAILAVRESPMASSEILRRAQLISASTQQPFLAYISAAVIYFALVFIANRLLARLERRLTIPSNP